MIAINKFAVNPTNEIGGSFTVGLLRDNGGASRIPPFPSVGFAPDLNDH